MNRLSALALALLCALDAHAATPREVTLEQATDIQRGMLTLDTHMDTPANFHRTGWSILDEHHGDDSQVDLPRMQRGAFDGGFFAIYTEQGERTPQSNRAARDAGLNRLIEIKQMLAANSSQFELALAPDDAKRIKAAGKHVVFISMENATPLASDPSLLEFYHREGLRLISLAHFLDNEFADSSTDPKGPEWHGISPAGKQLVAEANRLGIVLDQSHASDDVFDQLIELSKTPIILSHSSSKAVFNHPRNLDDARLRVLAAHGGVIQVNCYGGYLIDIPKSEARKRAEAELDAKYGDSEALPADKFNEYLAAQRAIDAKYPLKHATIDDFFRHLDHILAVVGPAHVGIGMDWDGGGGVDGMESVADLPKITRHLLAKGYSEAQIADIWGGNVMRVLQQAEDYAGTQP